MKADNLVLVGVVKRKKDLIVAQDEHWYRIPEGQAPRGLHADVVALFLSGAVFKEKNGGIHYYAYLQGEELAYRRDLFPDETEHKNADERYHKLQLSPLQLKIPPILNKPNPYRFAFIYTTWDRFQSAVHIRDLYSTADYFVDRVFYALREEGMQVKRDWEHRAGEMTYPTTAKLRILCENGEVVASVEVDHRTDGLIYLNPTQYLADPQRAVAQSLTKIQAEVRRRGGPRMVDIPVELD